MRAIRGHDCDHQLGLARDVVRLAEAAEASVRKGGDVVPLTEDELVPGIA